MKKIIFGIFAHPDDEAFGPSGYFIQQTRMGAELHLITLTLGENGANPDNHPVLATVREVEWRRGGELMGASGHYILGFTDGHLGNIDMISAAEKIDEIVTRVLDGLTDISVELVSTDLNGVTGHLDHIAAARAAALIFLRRKKSDSRFEKMRLITLPRTSLPTPNTDWIFMEAGRKEFEIDEVIDTREFRDEIVSVIRAHHSQRGDGEMHIKNRGADLGLYYFLTLE